MHLVVKVMDVAKYSTVPSRISFLPPGKALTSPMPRGGGGPSFISEGPHPHPALCLSLSRFLSLTAAQRATRFWWQAARCVLGIGCVLDTLSGV